jgi:two-component system, sensor histidine kinase and response regulator
VQDKPKFLLVDDIEDNLYALSALLRRPDIDILQARSGTAALELLGQHDIALAFIDVQMPGMDGFGLAEAMRSAEHSKHVPIIFVTAGPRESHRIFRGYESGAVDVLFKPIDPNILRHKADVFVQLYRQKQLLAHALQAREHMLAIVSHDLRDPLSVIGMTVSLLLAGSSAADPATKKQYEKLQRSVSLMQRMIGDLLDVASIQAGRFSIQRSEHEIASLVREAVATQELSARERSVRLIVGAVPTNARVWCDRERILQVFSNLIGNALKFCPSGATVTLCAAIEAGTAHFSVIDTGPGIESKELPHLFDAYWSGREHEQQGTGLGLHIVKGIIDAHGGKVWAESRLGEGTTFHFTLPLESAADDTGADTSAGTISGAGTKAAST